MLITNRWIFSLNLCRVNLCRRRHRGPRTRQVTEASTYWKEKNCNRFRDIIAQMLKILEKVKIVAQSDVKVSLTFRSHMLRPLVFSTKVPPGIPNPSNFVRRLPIHERNLFPNERRSKNLPTWDEASASHKCKCMTFSCCPQ